MDCASVKMMCWNVAGWAREDRNDGVQTVDDRDTRLKGDEVAGFDGYHWFAHNHSSLSRKAVRGSGGVGIMVKSSICQNWQIEIVDVTLEDVLWVKFQHQKSGCVAYVAVRYVPPVGSSGDVDVAEHFLLLEEQTQKFQAEGQVALCGDFNARFGGLRDVDCEMVDRCKCRHGEE